MTFIESKFLKVMLYKKLFVLLRDLKSVFLLAG